MSDLDTVLDAFSEADTPHERGPWCTICCHEYRDKRGNPQVYGTGCPYCGARDVAHTKPFYEVSKSSIELWERCNRRWFFKYIAHFPEPKNKFAAWGIEGHEVAEDYLARGIFPTVNDLDPKALQSKIARSVLGGVPHMPRPDHPGLKVETEFHFEFEGVRYGGFKDYEAPISWPLMSSCDPMVGDHKFTGKLQYAMTSFALAEDKQAVIYAWDVFRRTAFSRVCLNWVYMVRGEPIAQPVRAQINRDAAINGMRRLNVVGRHLTALKTRADLQAKHFPPNESACYDFKEACPHMDECDKCGDRQAINQIAHTGT